MKEHLRFITNEKNSTKKTDQIIDELLKFVHGKPNEEKKKITYAYFEKKEYEKRRKLN
jgi:ATP phosphoribosyltransferase